MSLSHIVTRAVERLGILPFRVLSYVLHATGLERFYKPRFHRNVAMQEIDAAFVAKLPKYCHTITGAESDPINLILIGSERDVRRSFRAAGWHRANPASPPHVFYGFLKALFKRSYQTGPFAPLYINIGLQDMAYQRSDTRRGGYRERHHLRIWRTGLTLSDGQRVWVAAGGHEDGMRFTFAIPFWSHSLDPDLDRERQYIASSLTKQGATLVKHVLLTTKVTKAKPKRSVFGSLYYTDGRAAVVEFRHDT